MPKYTENTVSVSSGVGTVPYPEFYAGAIAFYNSTEESVEITNGEFHITDTGYSGEVLLSYYYKDLCKLFSFRLGTSGITQLQTFLSKIIFYVRGSALALTLKNMIGNVVVKFPSVTAKCSSTKNAVSNILFNLGIVGRISSVKNISETFISSFDMDNHMSALRAMYSDINFVVTGSADVSTNRYRRMNEFTSSTLEELGTNTLEEMFYVQV